MTVRQLTWIVRIAWAGVGGGISLILLALVTHRSALVVIGGALFLVGAVAGMIGQGIVMAMTLEDD